MKDLEALSIIAPEEFCLKCKKCKAPLYLGVDSLFSPLPEGCGYSGWIFSEREKFKYKIRQFKEALVEQRALLKEELDSKSREKIESNIQKSQALIDKYAHLGSYDW